METTPELCTIILDSLEQTTETIFITDTKGVIVYANPSFERLTGYSIQEAVGRKASILKSEDHPDNFYAEMWDTITSGQDWRGRFINKRKDGTKYTSETRISPVRDEKGKITHYIAVRHDITKEAALEEQLMQSQKMEALGLLAGQLSHDFNNLLTIIIGSMELVIEELPKDGTSIKLAAGILKTSKESANLIKQLLIFARRQEYAPSVVDLNDTIKETKVLLDHLLGVNIKTRYDLAANLARVNMQADQFKQVLMNLAINAKDAIKAGGIIKIRTFNRAVAKNELHSIKTGDYAVIEISDNGSGIPPGVIEHVFEPFFTTKPKGKGTGLGLSTVYGIIKQHNGEILVGSEPGAGTTFTIYLPKTA